MMQKVSVVGLGKAGLPLAAVIAEAGHEVLGVDVSKRVVDMVNAGQCPIKGEAGLPEMIVTYGGKGLKATTDAVDASRRTTVHILIVPLFIDKRYQPDFSIVDAATKAVGKGLKRGDLVVMETTMPVGTTSTRLRGILEGNSGLTAGKDFSLAYSPERIMTGVSISRFKEFPKIVGGIDGESGRRAREFYSSFCKKVMQVADTQTAELTKIAEGVFRDVNIAVANELYRVCDEYGVDFWQMRQAARHEYCSIYEAGLGVGGHCIPVYPQFIIQDFKKRGKKAPLSLAARGVNDGMAEYFFGKLKAATKKKRPKVAVIGLTFREGVDELFYTRSRPLVSLMLKEGMDVYGVDPMLDGETIRREFKITPHKGEDFSGFDAAVLVNKNREYVKALKAAGIPVIDCKNVMG